LIQNFVKDDICLCIYGYYQKPFIELSDNKGIIHRYILIPYVYGYENIILEYTENNKNVSVSTDCKTNSQCFSNKCVNNLCDFNINSNVKRCDIVYEKPSLNSSGKEYIKCGRMVGEYCTNNSDCSFNNCVNKKCSDIHDKPSEWDYTTVRFQLLIIKILIFIILAIFICCYCCCVVKQYKTYIIDDNDK